MGVRFYDEALLNKLKYWTNHLQVTLTGVNETRRLFEILADKNNDKQIQLPLIALSRPGGYTLLNRNQRPLAHDGLAVHHSSERAAKVSNVPISIKYQLDIYCRYLDEADEFARNFVFNIINYPKLTIEFPYEDQHILHDANIRLASDIDDNSDIPERLIAGQFTRLTMNIEIDDAYLFDVRIKDNIVIRDISVLAHGQNDD